MSVQELNEFLKNADYTPLFTIGSGLLGVAACVLVLVTALHTLYAMGRKSPLYRTHQPVSGWNRRFYPASGVMIIFLLMLMWLLNVWSHRFTST